MQRSKADSRIIRQFESKPIIAAFLFQSEPMFSKQFALGFDSANQSGIEIMVGQARDVYDWMQVENRISWRTKNSNKLKETVLSLNGDKYFPGC